MSYTVSPNNYYELELNCSDTVKSILQNIACLLRTPKGSVPLYRNYGLDQSFLDKPSVTAKPRMLVAIKDAIEEFEPRAKFVGVTFKTDPSNPGRLVPQVEVDIVEQST